MEIAVALCCVAAVLLGIALWGPRRWYRDVTSEARPGTPEPTDSGYVLLSRRNWLAALVVVPIAISVTADAANLSERELYEATYDAVGSMEGMTGSVSSRRIKVAVEDRLEVKVNLEQVEQDSEERDDSVQFEITKYEEGRDSDAPAQGPAVCVEMETVGDSPRIDISSISSGPCSD